MRSGIFLLFLISMAGAAVAACPTHLKQSALDRLAMSDKMVSEAERQLDVFVSWARSGSQPDEVEAADEGDLTEIDDYVI